MGKKIKLYHPKTPVQEGMYCGQMLNLAVMQYVVAATFENTPVAVAYFIANRPKSLSIAGHLCEVFGEHYDPRLDLSLRNIAHKIEVQSRHNPLAVKIGEELRATADFIKEPEIELQRKRDDMHIEPDFTMQFAVYAEMLSQDEASRKGARFIRETLVNINASHARLDSLRVRPE